MANGGDDGRGRSSEDFFLFVRYGAHHDRWGHAHSYIYAYVLEAERQFGCPRITLQKFGEK